MHSCLGPRTSCAKRVNAVRVNENARTNVLRRTNSLRSRAVQTKASTNTDVKMLVQGLHLEITPAIDEYVRSKIGRACSHVDSRDIREVDVRCSARGGEGSKGGVEHKTEVTVLMTRGPTLHADGVGENLYATIDQCADIVTRSIRKHKEKHGGKGARHAAHDASPKEALLDAEDVDGDDVPPAA